MQELSKTELLNINGCSYIICTYHGLMKIIGWITKFISTRF